MSAIEKLKKKLPKDLPDPTPSQWKALEVFGDWFHTNIRKRKPILKIGSPAGYGKSFLIKYVMAMFNLNETNCYVVAYTGQAVNVLRQRGIHGKTIHSTFMQPKEVPLKDKSGKTITRNGIPYMITKFVPVKSLPSKIKLIICDEYSFVSEDFQKLMLKYKAPILAIGDPYQLPPVVGKQCFTMEDLDFELTDPIRQMKGNEIFDLATRIRNHELINFNDYGNQVYFANPKDCAEDTFHNYRACFKHADIILTATNKQRQLITDEYRRVIVGTESAYPKAGEPLICRRNDWNLRIGDYPLTNGTLGHCLFDIGRSAIDRKNGTYMMDFQPTYIENNYFDNLICNSKFLLEDFGQKEINRFDMGHMMEFAYAITVQLAQGYEADRVVFMDSAFSDKEYLARLRYTAVTRAKKWLVYILPYPM